MIRREIDRRTAIVALGSVLVTASAGWLGLKGTQRPSEVKAQGGAFVYVPPTTWDELPAVAQAQFLAWDQLVWQLEQAGNVSMVKNLIKSTMQTPGDDQTKANLAYFIKTSERSQYLYALLHGMDPTISSNNVRRSIIATMRHLHQIGMLDPIPDDLGQGMMTYLQSGAEQDAGVILMLSRLVAAYQAQ